MQENVVLSSSQLSVPLAPVETARLSAGAPLEGALPLLEVAGLELGVWEMTAGTASDVEVSEVFVVLEGEATVHFADHTPALTLQPGDIVRLAAGSKTSWQVSKKLRKLYLTLPEGQHD